MNGTPAELRQFLEFLGNGDGSFQPPVGYVHLASLGDPALVADFNGDRKSDLLTAAFGLFLNAGGTARNSTSVKVNSTGSDGTLFLQMQVSNGNASPAPTGLITITDNGTLISGIPSASGEAGVEVASLDSTGSANFSAPLAAGSHQIVATYSGDTHNKGSSATITVGATPDFNLGANGGSTLTVKQGQAGMITLVLTPVVGFNGQVSFSCTGLPAGASCSFNPSMLTPVLPQSNVTLTIATTGMTASRMRFLKGSFFAFAIVLFGFVSLVPRRPRTHGRLMRTGFLFLILVLGMLSGCGGGGGSGGHTTTVTPLGTSQVIVTATSGSDSHSMPITVTVTQ